MALYTIGDTHLSESLPKPMDIFGGAWVDYRNKLVKNLTEVLKPDDTLVICGDVSWGIDLDEALADFRLLDSMPGKKILLKGNHDYWWTTVKKMEDYFTANHIRTLNFLHNNFHSFQNTALCGTKGCPTAADDERSKVFNRELMRLEASVKLASDKGFESIYVFLHYPPVFQTTEITQLTEILRKYNVERVFYGHLHGHGIKSAFNGTRDGICYSLVSADYLGFRPVLLIP